MNTRKLSGVIAAILLISVGAGLVSAGEIAITNSDVYAGTAPSKGVVTYAENSAACPPELPAMPDIGTFSGESNGTDDFEAINVPPQELTGGTYNYRNYTVKNTTVSYNGTVTILTKGDVLIENGTVRTTNSSINITIIAGGDVVLQGGSLYTYNPTGPGTGASGSITVEAAGSVNVLDDALIGTDWGEASGDVLVKAFGTGTITLDGLSDISSGDAFGASGAVELWSGGSIELDSDSEVYSGDNYDTGTASGHVALYALGNNTITLDGYGDVFSGESLGTGASGYVALLSGGSIVLNDWSYVASGRSSEGVITGDVSLTAITAMTTITNDTFITTGDSTSTGGSILIQDFAPRPGGGEITVVDSEIYTKSVPTKSGDITFITGFNPCEAAPAHEAPGLTPIGVLALITALSTIAALRIRIGKRH